MYSRIEDVPEKLIIGMRTTTTLSNYVAPRLWSQFKPNRKEIKNLVSGEDYSIQLYNQVFSFSEFTPQTEFEYWAGAEVSEIESIPEEMELLVIPSGKYAIFVHKGLVSQFRNTLQYIYEEWLPDVGYVLDNRPHFEILGDRYLGVNHPESEEEIWVPIK